MKVFVTAEAYEEALEAVAWYEDNAERGKSEELSVAVRQVWHRLGAGEEVLRWASREHGLYRARVPGFEYQVIYWIEPEVGIGVLAVAHLRRPEAYWMGRFRRR